MAVEVYCYIPSGEVGNVIECGMSLLKWYDREVVIGGETRKCISALLNPKDDIEKYRSSHLKCIKLELPYKHCFIADRLLYEVGMRSDEARKLYMDSIIPSEKYIFGQYRLPECLVTSTILPGQISVLDKRVDSPVLFDSSEELYVNNVIEAFKESCPDFGDALLYSLFSRLVDCGRLHEIRDDEKKLTIFIDRSSGKTYTVRIPDMTLY